jgi:dTDP-4-dehydrorhamnose reductase
MVLLGIGKNLKPSIYHLTHEDFCNRLEVAQAVCEYFGKRLEDHFEVISDTNFGLAKRPVNGRMSSKKIKDALGLATLGSWREDLNYYLAKVYRK